MHRAANFLASQLSGTTRRADVPTLGLSAPQASSLRKALSGDAQDYYYTAWAAFVAGAGSTVAESYNWAAAQMYYAAFYCIRATLAQNGHCLFYWLKSPFSVTATQGANPRKERGTTHAVVIDLFRRKYSHHLLLSQTVEEINAPTWLAKIRETAQYGNKTADPDVPRCFARAKQYGVRRVMETYLADSNLLYAFDPEHAVIAYPLQLLVMARPVLARGVSETDTRQLVPQESLDFLKKLARDKSGPVSAMVREVDSSFRS